MGNAITLMQWYVAEAARLRNAPRADPRLQRAALLLDWLTGNRANVEFTAADLKRFAPNALRNLETIRDALAVLAEHGWVVAVTKKRWRLVGTSGPEK